jgi:hypothetical protein
VLSEAKSRCGVCGKQGAGEIARGARGLIAVHDY